MIAIPALAATKTAVVLAGLLSCAPAPTPQIEMHYTHTDPVTSSTLPSSALNHFSHDTRISHGPNEILNTGGITESSINEGFSIDFVTTPVQGATCLHIKSVTLTLAYTPVIHIASEFPPGGCHYNVTLQHEARHVNTDLITLGEYAPKITAAVQQALAGLPPPSPLAQDQVNTEKDAMTARIKQALAAVTTEMDQVRFARQQLIDTRQEYLRVQHACDAQ